MATADGVPVIACCPPGFHDRNPGCATHVGTAYGFDPVPRMWFTLNFVHAVLFCGRFPGWTAAMGKDGQILMGYDSTEAFRLVPNVARATPERRYVWRMTGVRGGPNEFWHEGAWPD